MGFFKSITRAISRPVQQFVKSPLKVIKALPKTVAKVGQTIIKDPVRASLAVSTGGGSELLRMAPVAGGIYSKGVSLASEGFKASANIYTGGLYGQATQVANTLATSITGKDPMALNIGGILQQAGSIFGAGQNPYFQGTSGVLNLASNFFPQPSSRGVISSPSPIVPVMSAGIGAAVRSLPSIGRGLYNRFPNLAAGMNALRLAGRNVKRSQLYSIAKRFGPEFLVTGGILSAAAVTELLMAGPGRRRMNAANPKALRRAAGRIRSFHKMCSTVDLLKTKGHRYKKAC